jgi:ATP-dependent Lhr-like helicase
MKENRNACKEFKALSSFLEKQEALSAIPSSNQLLIESFESREGHHLLVYPFEGRYVHEAMCALLAYRISQEFPISFSLAYNDYGFEILSDQFVDPELIRSKALLRVEDMHEDLLESVNAAEIAKRTFRDIAVISGLVFTGPPDKRKKDKHLQSSAQMFFSVFEDYEPENLLFNQAYSEVYAYQFQQERMEQAMQRMSKQELLIQSCPKPSPFSFPIITDRLRARMSSEALGDKIKRMIAEYTKA